MFSWDKVFMLLVGLGMAVTMYFQKTDLKSGIDWRRVLLSHNTGVWIPLIVFFSYTVFAEHGKLGFTPRSFLGGLITGLTATFSVYYLSRHTAGETMIAIRASASIFMLLIGLTLLGERPDLKQWVGFTLVIIGTLLL